MEKDFNKYNYLKQSGCFTIDGVDDAAEFAHLRKALKGCGISEEMQENIYEVLAGLLHLGNIGFTAIQEKKKSEKENDVFTASTVDDKVQVSKESLTSLEIAASLLGIDKEMLRERLVTRTITVGNKPSSIGNVKLRPTGSNSNNAVDKENTYTIQLSEQEAIVSRDSLAKYIYSAVFEFIVSQINKNLPCVNSSNYIGSSIFYSLLIGRNFGSFWI